MDLLGFGKTTLANIIANEMNSNIRITSGPAIEKPGDLAAILTNLQQNDVLFIDEIHRLHNHGSSYILQQLIHKMFPVVHHSLIHLS